MSKEVTRWKIPQKYFDMLPEPLKSDNSNREIIQLRNSLAMFFYLYDLSREEREKIIKELLKKPYKTILDFHPLLDPMVYFLVFSEEFQRRYVSALKQVLKKFKRQRLTNPRLLLYLVYPMVRYPKISETEKRFLIEVVRNPAGSFREWSKNVGLSVSGTKKIYEKLRKKTAFRLYSLINFAALKLKHYFVRISGANVREQKMLKEKVQQVPWLRSVFGFASDPNILFITFTIPAHAKCVKVFFEMADKFERFGHVKIYETSKLATSVNLHRYDPKVGWKSYSDNWLDPLFNSGKKSFGWEEFIHIVSYTKIFDLYLSKKDIDIIKCLQRDLRMNEKILSETSGYPLSIVKKRKKEFLKRNVIVPSIHLMVRGLEGDATLFFDEKYDYNNLVKIFSELPAATTYKLKDVISGEYLIMLHVKLSGSIFWNVIKTFNNYKEKIGLKDVYYEYRGTYSFVIDRFADRWNEKKQHWNWSEEDFLIL